MAVTHLDHTGEEVRLKQAEMIAQWVRNQTNPALLMGDFSDNPRSEAHNVLTSRETGLRDAWQVLGRSEGPESFSHHAFSGKPKQARIDWILATSPLGVTNAKMVHDAFDGRYASDHFPFYADFSWE